MAASTIIGCQLGHESMVGVSYCNNSDFSTIAASCCGHNLTTSFLRSSASVFHGHRELNSNPLASNLSRLFSHKGVQLHKHVTTSMLIPKMQATKGGQVVCFGEMLIDFVPTVGGVSLAEAPAFKKAPGGAPANVAVGIAKLGGKSAFIGKVGQDEFGVMLVNMLNEHNVESKGVRLDPGARTALAFVTLRSDGEREFMFYRNPSADMLLQPTELDLDLIKQATIFHYGSISLIADPCRSAHELAMKTAKEAGNLLSYDPNLRLPLWPSAQEARQGIFSIWDQADVIKVSEEEITFLTEGGDPYSDEAARALWRPSLKLLLVTEGALGCRYYTKDFQGRVEGIKVEAVDTTGAGDAFVAGVLSQLVNDMTLFEDENKLRNVLLFANACGAITTTERGAIPALPTKEAVLEIVRNR